MCRVIIVIRGSLHIWQEKGTTTKAGGVVEVVEVEEEEEVVVVCVAELLLCHLLDREPT